MILSTERIKLRAFRPGDEPSIVRHGDNRAVSRNLRDRFPSPYTHPDALDWVQRAGTADPVCAFAIEFSGELVGGIGLVLGYWLGETH